MRTVGIIFSALIVLFISFTACSTSEPENQKTYYTEQYRPQFHFSPDSMLSLTCLPLSFLWTMEPW